MNAPVAPVLALALALAALISPAAAAAGDQPLTGPQLAELLGPGAPPSPMRWSCTRGPDSCVYRGQLVDGSPAGVGFYLGLAPAFKPDAHATAHPARLGAFEVVWQRWRREGSLYQTTLLTLSSDDAGGEGSFIHAWIYGPDPASLEALARQLGALPRFAHAPAAR